MTDPVNPPYDLRIIYDVHDAEPITATRFDGSRIRILPRTAIVSTHVYPLSGARSYLSIEGRVLRLTDNQPGRNIGHVAYWPDDHAHEGKAITDAPQWAQDLYADALRRIKAALA